MDFNRVSLVHHISFASMVTYLLLIFLKQCLVSNNYRKFKKKSLFLRDHFNSGCTYTIRLCPGGTQVFCHKYFIFDKVI